MIFDTDILIWVQRGNLRALAAIGAEPLRRIATLTYMELLQNAKNKAQMANTKSFLLEFDFEIVPLSANIGHRAMIYVEEYGLSHGMEAGDALVAATATELGAPLLSSNVKHFKAVKELDLRRFKVE